MPFSKVILTSRTLNGNGVRRFTWFTRSNTVHSDDPKLILGSLHQSGDTVVCVWGRSKGGLHPAGTGRCTHLDGVANDSGSSVTGGWRP